MTGNPPATGQMTYGSDGRAGSEDIDSVSKWLVLTRAAVTPMTLISAAIGGLLAVGHADTNWLWFALATIGLLGAHAANNLMNDLYDTDVGLDTDNYPRAMYAPHPVVSGWISRRGLAAAALGVNLGCLAIMIVLFWARGWPILAFALGGFLLSFFYTAPPLRLKRIGLGEVDVFVVWGPLMVGGTFYATTGTIGWDVIAASLPWSLLTTTVLMGKHIDKIPWDGPKRIHTLPVLLGEALSRKLTQAMIVIFYLSLIPLAAVGYLPWFTLLTVLALPRAVMVLKQFSSPKPDSPPERFPPIWPLWFAPLAFYHLRRAGSLFVLGLIAGVVLQQTLGWG